MSDVDKVIKVIRPSLRKIAPQTYWFIVGFGVFNILVGFALFMLYSLVKLVLLGVLPVRVWGVIFFVMGVASLYFALVNNWKMSRGVTLAWIVINSAWWLELIAGFIINHSPFVLFIWSFLLYLQIINFRHFTPRVSRNELRR